MWIIYIYMYTYIYRERGRQLLLTMYKYLLIIYKLYMFVAYIHSLSIYMVVFTNYYMHYGLAWDPSRLLHALWFWPGTHPDSYIHPDYYIQSGLGLGPIQMVILQTQPCAI